MTEPAELTSLPAGERLRRLYELHNAREFAVIAALGSGHIATAPMPEALIVANACYQLDDCREALSALRRRAIEDRFADRHINLLLGMARRAEDWRELIAICKIAIRRDPARSELAGYVATALRRLRRTREVERLCAHVVWLYRRGRLPTGLFIDILRAMRTRRPVLALEHEIGPLSDRSARGSFIEALIELSRFDEAGSAMRRLGIAPDDLSAANRAAMVYLEDRKQALGVTSFAALRTAVLAALDGACRPDAGPGRPAASRRILVMASSLGMGGSERQLSYLVDGLARWAKVTIYCQTARGHARASYEFACPIHYVGDDDLTGIGRETDGGLSESLSQDLQFVFGTAAIADICALAVKFRPDVVYCAYGLPTEALLVAHALGMTNALVRFGGETFYNNFDTSDDNRRRIEVAEYCCRELSDSARFVTNSHFARSAWAHRVHLPETAVTVIPNGVPSPDVADPTAAPPWTFPANAFVVGWVGRFHDIKRPRLWLDVAFELARRHADVHFLMIGDGPLRADAEARIARHGLEGCFVFTGVLSGSLSAGYRAMDVLLQTSATESFPNVILEALSHGVPVVARPVGDIALILDDRRLGLCVDGDEVAAYVRVIEAVRHDRHRLAADKDYRSRHVLERYGMDAMCQAYARLLDVGAGGVVGESTEMRPLPDVEKMT